MKCLSKARAMQQIMFYAVFGLILLHAANASQDSTPSSIDLTELNEDDNGDVTLPSIEDFFNGLDYTTNRRRGRIFTPTYQKAVKEAEASSESGSYRYYAKTMGKWLRSPDQLDVSNFGAECKTAYILRESRFSSFESFLKSKSRSTSFGYEQTTDISVSVPVGPAEVTMGTQTQNSLGYSKSVSSENYKSSLKQGMEVSTFRRAVMKQWSVQWTDMTIDDIRSHLSSGFKTTAAHLKEACTRKGSFDERFSAYHAARVPSLCESRAKSFVDQYGTHFNKRATFGGTFEMGYHYKERSMTTEEKNSVQRYSRLNAGYLFFKADRVDQSTETKYNKLENHNLVVTHEATWFGGDPSVDSARHWCQTVINNPAIIVNDILGLVSELLDDHVSKVAVTFAILDRFVCNGGFYYGINKRYPELGGSCHCEYDSDFELDKFCRPVRRRCHGDPFCNIPKILVGYTKKYSGLDGYGMLGATENLHDVRFYKPVAPPDYEICGTVACRYKSPPPGEDVVVIHKDTSEEVAKYIKSTRPGAKSGASMYQPFGCKQKVYRDHGNCHHHIDHLYPYRPRCPAGYNHISDFETYRRDSWDGSSAYYNEFIRGCFRRECLRECQAKWIWDAGNGKYNMMVLRIAGGEPALGSDVYSRKGVCGFFTTVMNKQSYPSVENRLCLRPECIRKVQD